MDSLSIRFDNDDVQTWVRKTEIMHHRQLAVSLFASPWGIGLAYILLLYSCCMMFSYALFDLCLLSYVKWDANGLGWERIAFIIICARLRGFSFGWWA